MTNKLGMLLSVLLAFASSPAFAGDEVNPSSETAEIIQIPEGTLITLKGKPAFTVDRFSYLLPESHFDEALISAKKLTICEPALERSYATTLRWIDVSDKALAVCEGQFSTDTAAVTQLTEQVRTLETRAITAETRLKDVRQQRTVAWAITGGLVLGAIAVTAVAIGG